MLLSLDWLKDFVDIPRSLSPEELGLRLTMHTVEIESVKKQSDKFKDIIVGKIVAVKNHPNADKLSLAIVDIGDRQLSIVCGAANIEAGQNVPVALAGSTLPNGMEIKEVEVRGEKSEGMLCAEDELGLGEDHSGILILGKKAKVGQDLAEHLGLKDVVFEVDNKSLTHRPDLWSHYGIAREIAAFLKTKFKAYQPGRKNVEAKGIASEINVKIEDFSLCPRYMAISMEGIKVEPSPQWMQERLIAAGMRPINNIVDITNYVMLELGQPLHAFDRSLVDKIIVRRATDKEIIETLDGEKRELSDDILVIADSKAPIAIAGIMGGLTSEINENTKEIIIESANFNFISIRKTSSRLGLRTESSIRFEKALDPNLAEAAIIRTVELVKKLCSGTKMSSALADEKRFELDQGPIELNLGWLNKRLGVELEKAKVKEVLYKLGFLTEDSDKGLKATVPTWRATRDISIPEDLVEEVARIYGYDNIKLSMPKVSMEAPPTSDERILLKEIRNILSGSLSLAEVYNYSFVSEEQLEKLGIDYSTHLRLANPIASHQTLLRQSLAPNLLNNVKTNQARFDSFGIFEIGSIYLSSTGNINKEDKSKEALPYQEKRLSIVVAGEDKRIIFSRLKGYISLFLDSFNIEHTYGITGTAPAWAKKEKSADIIADNKPIGGVYLLDGRIAKSNNIKKKVYLADISLVEFNRIIATSGDYKFKEYEKYPPLLRDLAFVVNEKILYNDISGEILQFSELINHVELFDVYSGEKLGKDKKNLAFHVYYQADRTLKGEEVDKIQAELIKHIEEKFEAKVRDF